MTTSDSEIKTLNIRELFEDKEDYLIPVYQRNFAWSEKEITQLIQDIIDYIPQNDSSNKKNYYLGTLVVYERNEGKYSIYETIDGQQRLTTLSILLSVIKNIYADMDLSWFTQIKLNFESRKTSTKTLNAALKGSFDSNSNYNESIKEAFELICNILPIKLSENNLKIEEFCNYLFDKVKILRVPVPEDTDLNHYFEIMNNRGEQLEKHEILKSNLLEVFNQIEDQETKKLYSDCFHIIWEACSNMEKYVQYGFSTEQRNNLFSSNNWDNFTCKNPEDVFDKLKNKLNNDGKITYSIENSNQEKTSLTIDEIIAGKTLNKPEYLSDDSPERFNSVINFPNFLLHILKIQTQTDIPLDDKRLLKTFKDEIEKQTDKVGFTKQFIFNLLKGKFLFDKYIIKREYISGKDRWSLKRLRCYDKNKVNYVNTFGDESNGGDFNENQKTLMLLSMFHVSTPTLVYKHWLNAAMNYLFKNQEFEANDYVQYLENIAKTFVFDRFLSKNPRDYFDIIYKEVTFKNNIHDLDLNKLRFNEITNNLVFNYLDYLLWLKHKESNSNIINFEFTFRSSVEHYYPQNPMKGFNKLQPEYLNSFGNLCLISHSKNSKLSNFMPLAKRQHYAQNNIDSIKQYIMMNDYNADKWDEESIKDHETKMIEILFKELNK